MEKQTPQFHYFDGCLLSIALFRQTSNSIDIKLPNGNSEPMTKLSNNQWNFTLPLKLEDIGRTVVWSFEEKSASGDVIGSEKCPRSFPIDPLIFRKNPLYTLNLEWDVYPFEMTSYCVKCVKSVTVRSVLEHSRPENESFVLKQIPISEHRSLSIDQKGFSFLEMVKEDTNKIMSKDPLKDVLGVLYKSCSVTVNTMSHDEKTVPLCDLHFKFAPETNLAKALAQIFDEVSQFIPKLDLHSNSCKYEFLAQITEEPLEEWYIDDGSKKKPEEEIVPIVLTKTQQAIGNKASPCSHFTNSICALKKNKGIICYEVLDWKMLVLANLDNGAVMRVLDVFETQIFNIRSFIFNEKEHIVAVDAKSIRVFEQNVENWRKIADIRHGLTAGVNCTAELINSPFCEDLNVLFCGNCADGILHFNLSGQLLQKLPFPALYTNYIQSEDCLIACTSSGLAKINLSKAQLIKKGSDTCSFLKNELFVFNGKKSIFAVSGSNLYIYDNKSMEKVKEIVIEGNLYDFIEWTFEKNQFLILASYGSGKVIVVNPNTGDKIVLSSGLGYSSHVSSCVYRGKVGLVVGGCYSKVQVLTKKD